MTSRAYYNDTATHRISVFDYDAEAGLTHRRVFVEIPEDGRPDGLTVDSEGGVWTAISNTGAVHRYSAEGRLEEVLKVPARKATACTFGGQQLDELFITTSREGLPEGQDPLAGSLFRARPQVLGLPAREFAG
jgi:sugar lactone lactonase YvrE